MSKDRGNNVRARPLAMDQLPRQADSIHQWAADAIESRRLTQQSILSDVNAKLSAIGLPPISKSSFNRWIHQGLEHGFAPRVPVIENENEETCPRCGASSAHWTIDQQSRSERADV